MTRPSVIVSGYADAVTRMSRPDHGISALIAIHGRRESAVECSLSPQLQLEFDDVVGRAGFPPNRQHVQQILTFAKSIQSIDGVLYCHCWAGISRSTAAALLCLAVWEGPGREPECVQELLKIRPESKPHPTMVRIGDQLLQCNGRLIEALRLATST